MINKEITPQSLVDLGWKLHLIQTDKDVKFGEEPKIIYKKSFVDHNCSDCYNYEWTFYAPNFFMYNEGWSTCEEFIIEEKQSGGFFGIIEEYTIFRGHLYTLEDYNNIVKLTHLKYGNQITAF